MANNNNNNGGGMSFWGMVGAILVALFIFFSDWLIWFVKT